MSKILLAGEAKNRQKSRTISTIIHLLLLLIMFFYFFPAVPAKDPDIPPKIVMDFSYQPSSLSKYAHADAGKAKPKTENVEKVKTTKPVEVKPTEVKKVEIKRDPIVKPDIKPVTTPNTQPEAPIEIPQDDVEIIDPEIELEDVPEPEPIPVEEVEPVNDTPAETADDPSKTDGKGKEDPSMTNGEVGGTGKGNDGTGPGKDSGNDSTSGEGDAGDGTGVYDDTGDGVFGRRVIFRNTKGVYGVAHQTGVIAAKVCINRMGIVTYAEIMEFESTVKDRRTLKKALEAFQGYKYEPDPKAPKEQCGKLTLEIEKNFLAN